MSLSFVHQVASADIAMNAGEPHLFHDLLLRGVSIAGSIGVGRTAPHCFIDCQCLTGRIDGGAQVRVVKLLPSPIQQIDQAQPRPTEIPRAPTVSQTPMKPMRVLV